MSQNPDLAARSSPSAALRSPVFSRADGKNRSAMTAIKAAGRLITQIGTDPQLNSALARFGFDPDRLQEGAMLQELALHACLDCEQALGALATAHAGRARTFAAAREDYAAFRVAVKRLCSPAAPADALDFSIAVRQHVRRFVVQATASYLAALKILPPDFLSHQDFAPARINAALVCLQQLANEDRVVSHRSQRVAQLARARDRAVGRLNQWVNELFCTAKLAFGRVATPPAPRPSARELRRIPRAPRPAGECPAWDLPLRFALRFG